MRSSIQKPWTIGHLRICLAKTNGVQRKRYRYGAHAAHCAAYTHDKCWGGKYQDGQPVNGSTHPEPIFGNWRSWMQSRRCVHGNITCFRHATSLISVHCIKTFGDDSHAAYFISERRAKEAPGISTERRAIHQQHACAWDLHGTAARVPVIVR
jgi:hypothetical protein